MKWIQFFTIFLVNMTIALLVIRHYYTIPVRIEKVPYTAVVYKYKVIKACTTVKTVYTNGLSGTDMNTMIQTAGAVCQKNYSGGQSSLTHFYIDSQNHPQFWCGN